MTKVTYILANGTKVATKAQAIASGQKYRTTYEPITEKIPKRTPKQESMLIKL